MTATAFSYPDGISAETIQLVEDNANKVGPDGHSLNSLLAHFEQSAAELKAKREAEQNKAADPNAIIHDPNLWFPVGHTPIDGLKRMIVGACVKVKTITVNTFKVDDHHFPVGHKRNPGTCTHAVSVPASEHGQSVH